MKNLKNIREKRNINQLKLAIDIGITQESISKYETGKAFPSKDVLIKLADYLNCSVDYLLDRTSNPNMMENLRIDADDKIENLIFRYNRLSEQNKNKLEGCLMILEQENNIKS